MNATEPKTYNGWTNYETWCVHLWLTNDQESDSGARQNALAFWEESKADGVLSRSEAARFAYADALKSDFTDNVPEGLAGVYSDLVNAALSEVDWSEIADAFLSDCEDEDGEKYERSE